MDVERHFSMVCFLESLNRSRVGLLYYLLLLLHRDCPYLLAFAAGAMIYVVVEELIPEAAEGEHSNIGTIGFAAGFVLMMILDVALG